MHFFPLLSVAATLVVPATALPKLQQRQAPTGVPDYVLNYAPLVYLYSGEQYFPSDIRAQVSNTIPEINFSPVANVANPLDLNSLNTLSQDVYLTSKDDITKSPAWLRGVKLDGSGKTNNAVTAAVIVNDKGSGNVDAFYMYFYAYNWGGIVAGIKSLQFGNHVGDWEHNMIRFSSGVPQYIWYSQHSNGEAFKYSVVEKSGLRPIVYSANGSHANYAISGTHDHTIPNLNLPAGFLEDHTDKGTLWDPLLSSYHYSYTPSGNSFTPYDTTGTTPVNWLYFNGRWGDQEYPTSDKRQVKVFGQAKYASGPTGPADKQLNRSNVCPDNGQECILRTILVPKDLGELER
ncbi:uncharacterized protein BDR25DRAFT_375238 [Lindgomyces ingoldianus]|uniref:Uncharacterized protein n=1 Tax=Lindgomyces ingoldianus TaxID=673940 RepID=A0ACB6RAK6_9PLEO|nr:uncharacterized protein BDR25DRAFT_375238 [Lindgomyces ingoldianus]KAF2476344.1 hypothetical protein BDR25DRAFT_375238 [Lindgomyces ingoldianus]